MNKKEKRILAISIFVVLLISLTTLLLAHFAIREVVTLQKISHFTVTELEDLKAFILEGKVDDSKSVSKEVDAYFEMDRGSGCSNFTIYKSNKGSSLVLVVRGDGEVFDEFDNSYSWRIHEQRNNTRATAELYKFDPPLSDPDQIFPFCNDIAGAQEGEEYEAIQGTVYLYKTDLPGDTYLIDAHVENAIFTMDGEEIVIEYTKFDDVEVGWYPG